MHSEVPLTLRDVSSQAGDDKCGDRAVNIPRREKIDSGKSLVADKESCVVEHHSPKNDCEG